jgi:cell wall-associated NlpC family hydrolase
MQFGICLLSVVPCRKEPSGTSEMITQLLFGEHYFVLEIQNDWLKIKVAYDNYECWISSKQHSKINESTFKYLQKLSPNLVSSLVERIENKITPQSFYITLGASLPLLNQHTISFESFVFNYVGNSTDTKIKSGAEKIIETAQQLINTPYLWGGKSPFGIDCSGFTQIVYKLNGYQLPRDAYQQVELGEALSFVEEAEAGDLAFFDNEEGKIVHVGILLNNQQIIHASGFVRIDKFDHYGIFNSDRGKYSHTLRVLKRII